MPVRKSLNHIAPSPVKNIIDEDAPMSRGIVTILRSDCERSKAGSIRRTLSADMSSKKWLEKNGFFSPMKKIVSSEALVFPSHDYSSLSSSSSSSSSSSESDEENQETPSQDDVWRSIQAQKERDEMQKPAQIQVWASLLSRKRENSLLPPPYVHPLAKRSASSLSEKSLEICTESLGSETGSDCFSSHCSEILSDGDEKKEDRRRVVRQELKDSNLVADSHVANKSPARLFPPPPLPSIAGGDGVSLHMRSHREKGRLVLEAVSVRPRNYFHAQRQDGRLLLTLIHAPATTSAKIEVAEVEKMFDNMEAVDEEIQEEDKVENDRGDDGYKEDLEAEEEVVEEKSVTKKEEFVMEQNSSLPSGMVRVQKSGLLMKKLIAVGNINPTWSKKINKADELITVEEEVPLQQSLPSPPRMPRMIPPLAAASFNAYEYVWRNKTIVSGDFISPLFTNKNPNKINDGTKGYKNQDLLLMKGSKTEQFVPYLRGCKEARRSLLIWEPYCIATS